MIFEEKGIPDSTVLRLVAKVLEKSQTAKGYKVKTKDGEKKLTAEEVVEFVRKLSAGIEEGSYGVIRRCDTCGNFSRSGKSKKRGWCSPKECSLFRNTTDYCNRWIPMSPEQKYIKERIDEHFNVRSD